MVAVKVVVLLALVAASLTMDESMIVRVALKQRNVEKLEKLLLRVSNTDDKMYGKYPSVDHVAALIGVSDTEFLDLQSWLEDRGAVSSTLRPTRDYVEVRMLSENARALIEANDLHPLVEQIAKPHRASSNEKMLHKQLRRARSPDAASGTPNNQKASYGIPTTAYGSNSQNQQMVWGPGTYGYLASDLSSYFKTFSVNSSASRVSHQGSSGVPGGDNWTEGSLDTQVISALGMQVPTINCNSNTTMSTEEGLGFGYAFLDFVNELSGASSVPLVLSMSLGSLSWESCNMLCETVTANHKLISFSACEKYMSSQRQVCMYDSSIQVQRISTEFIKLGLRGMTLLAASGDGGSHFSFERFPTDSIIGAALNDASCQLNSPTFPAASPYVLGVGGTQWSSPGSQMKPVAWTASGSGFAWEFGRPSYQADVVSWYLGNNTDQLPPSSSFNSSNRAYPDIAALADNVPIFLQGSEEVVGGTSCSAPAWAGIVSLLNDIRLNNQLPPLGFVNPRFYQVAQAHPGEAFYDMSEGTSSCDSSGFCCSTGFPAAVGWDPTTGLGSPIWTGLVKYMTTD